ncbi:hypothetical protein PM10SUCC1_00440 [Propionigenium maris DSM 9537]|uniref:GGDEF domain-containing protein n=1 Tax=Propionigenium maris DSM 9537 TaxID=1123000 RepID=A0A9W6LLB4_9FUSO|nr:GGDEF domain-containing protein [Propionigenium maris]GLI54529.1 hypothetical protein PM10SUCC1_00440 [Propionigenium maris DSM 9537]
MAVKKLQSLTRVFNEGFSGIVDISGNLKIEIKNLISITLLLLPLICVTSMGEEPINVLFLSSFEKGIPASTALERGLIRTFDTNSQKENLYFEYMDSQKLEHDSYGFYKEYLKGKYSNIKFDYIICWGFNSIELLTSQRDIFPDSKRVLLEGSKGLPKEEGILERDLVIKSVPDYSATVEEILRIRETEKIIVIGTSGKVGQNRVNILKGVIEKLSRDIEVEYLIDRNIYEISKELTKAGDGTIAFYLLMFSDGFGEKLTPYEVSEIICRNSRIPVFSFWKVLLGSGIAGGYLISFEVIGEEIGRVIFSGEGNNYQEIFPMSAAYDYRALEKWDIDEERILPTARIINKPPSFFLRHRVGIFVLLLTITFIIIVSCLVYRQLLMKETNKKFKELYDEIKRKNQQLNILSEIDPLTGLKNRRAIHKDIKNEMKRSSRYGTPMSVLLMDVDYFKRINDTYGHSVGDKVLSELSQLLRENVRATDSVARWGGDEVLILAANIDLQEAIKFGEKLRRKVEEFDFTGIGGLTVSIGISQRKPGEPFNKLYERVDEALYSAKKSGRNTLGH